MIYSTFQDIKSNKQKELTKVFDIPKKKIKWERKLADVLIYVCVHVYERKLLISYCHDNEEADDTLMTEKFFAFDSKLHINLVCNLP